MAETSVIGGAMLPHAPQFFTMPETEDRATVDGSRRWRRRSAAGSKRSSPICGSSSATTMQSSSSITCAPAFTVHVGGSARGSFAGREFDWQVPGEIGFEIVEGLYRQGFDPAFTSTAKIDYAMGIPLTHLGIEDPVLPISVNAYLPPQPTMERCYAFGEAVARVVTSLGLRTAASRAAACRIIPAPNAMPSPTSPGTRRRWRGSRRATSNR